VAGAETAQAVWEANEGETMNAQTITILTGADMLNCPVLDYQTGEDTGRVATAEDVARQVRAGDGAYECPETGRSVYVSR
jgi:hypothetical protein